MNQINNKFREFSSNTKVCDLISTDYSSLLIITRFGIPLGIGDSTIEDVCKKHDVDINTLLLVLNTTRDIVHHPSEKEIERLSLNSLLSYLSKSHDYFLYFRLPVLRNQLISAISNCPTDVAVVIAKFFDEYVEEVRKHMNYEDKTVFPYAKKLEKGIESGSYNIGIFSRRHEQIELKITELKNILIKYYPSPSGYELTSVLHDIFACEEDLASHNRVEDFIFVPYIQMLEKNQGNR